MCKKLPELGMRGMLNGITEGLCSWEKESEDEMEAKTQDSLGLRFNCTRSFEGEGIATNNAIRRCIWRN